MSTVHLSLPKLHPAQARVKSEARRFNVLCAGRRIGKSVLSRDRLITPALLGKPTAYFCPTYKMLADYWRETVAALFPILDKSNVQEKRLQLITGGVIDMWSLDEPNAARGRKYAHVAIDEAAMIARLEEAWQEVIRPTLADYRGSADFYSTPKGHNFFWQLWQRGQDPEQGDWASWQMPTSANPYIDPAEIEAARRELPERTFEQEFLATFTDDGGGVFRKVREAATAERVQPYPGEFVAGLDWAKDNDFTVMVIIDAKSRRMVDCDRFNRIDWSVQRSRVVTLANKWRVKSILAEGNSIGSPNIEALRKVDRLPVHEFTTTNQSKADIIEALVLAFERSDIAIFDDPVIIGELQAYEATRLPSGLTRYGAAGSGHDDTVMALALAWWSIAGVKSKKLVSF